MDGTGRINPVVSVGKKHNTAQARARVRARNDAIAKPEVRRPHLRIRFKQHLQKYGVFSLYSQ